MNKIIYENYVKLKLTKFINILKKTLKTLNTKINNIYFYNQNKCCMIEIFKSEVLEYINKKGIVVYDI